MTLHARRGSGKKLTKASRMAHILVPDPKIYLMALLAKRCVFARQSCLPLNGWCLQAASGLEISISQLTQFFHLALITSTTVGPSIIHLTVNSITRTNFYHRQAQLCATRRVHSRALDHQTRVNHQQGCLYSICHGPLQMPWQSHCDDGAAISDCQDGV